PRCVDPSPTRRSSDLREKLAFHLRASGADSVIHFAAHKQVGESVENPEMYWHDNIGGLANVLSACASAEVRDVVFSSSAAVYGVDRKSTRLNSSHVKT